MACAAVPAKPGAHLHWQTAEGFLYSRSAAWCHHL